MPNTLPAYSAQDRQQQQSEINCMCALPGKPFEPVTRAQHRPAPTAPCWQDIENGPRQMSTEKCLVHKTQHGKKRNNETSKRKKGGTRPRPTTEPQNQQHDHGQRQPGHPKRGIDIPPRVNHHQWIRPSQLRQVEPDRITCGHPSLRPGSKFKLLINEPLVLGPDRNNSCCKRHQDNRREAKDVAPTPMALDPPSAQTKNHRQNDGGSLARHRHRSENQRQNVVRISIALRD